ncbi:PAS domain S-box-containing protein [Halarchaeum solikamskense]|uniref:PAS domain S-box protein n=1 Tax=Halarchaeum nitratireducens TaxID=489913 RepID=UPI001B3A9C3F|nr:PAS domain S-box protein [Halarchaeum solikamskense]MBP2251007.1 PAS domain S-box-containing protein [Halarchaeum solikamskense]
MSEQPSPIRILHVDDEPGFADLVATYLQREDDRFEVELAANAGDGLDRLADAEFDCIVSDHDMPGQNGIEFLEAVRDDHPDLPFILFTGKGSEEVASEAISAGVTDYLQKGGGTHQYTVLANRIRNVVEKWHTEREAERIRTRLEAITANSNDAILTIDAEGTIQFVNRAAEEMFGYERDSLVGEPLTTLVPPRHREAHLDAMERYLETGERTIDWKAVEFPGRHRDGHEIPLSVSFNEFEEDDERRFVGVLRDISDRVRMEEDLRERERRFRQMAENLQEIVWMTDPEKEELIYVNRAYEEIWGRSAEGLYESPRSFLDAVHPDDRDRIEDALDAQATGTYEEEYRVRRPDGEVRWVNDRAVPIENDAGEVYRIVGITSDITDRKEREQEYDRLLDLLDHTEQIADVGGWEIDPETEDVFWSDHLFEMLGWDDDEEPPLGEALDVYVEDDRARVENAVRDAIEAGDSVDVEARFQRRDGGVRRFRIRGEPTLDGGEVVALRGAVQDITEQKHREQELRDEQQFVQSIYNALPDPLYAFDTNGDPIRWNVRLEEITGYTGDDIRGMSVTDFVPADEAETVAEKFQRVLEDEASVTFESAIRTRDGERLPYEFTGGPLKDANGELVGVTGIGRDIQARKERERELQERNERLNEFASIVSHDLQTPLNVVEGRVELAREECDSEHLDQIDTALDRMTRILEDVLWLAREGRDIGSTEPVALRSAVESAWNLVSESADGAELRYADDEGGLRTIRADSDRLSQLLENLLGNAVEHGGDDVTITVGGLDDGFYVEDDGPGIPTEKRERLFEMGYSTSEGGTGFGMSIVKQVADAHGWDVRVTDGSESGARFEITGVEFS